MQASQRPPRAFRITLALSPSGSLDRRAHAPATDAASTESRNRTQSGAHYAGYHHSFTAGLRKLRRRFLGNKATGRAPMVGTPQQKPARALARTGPMASAKPESGLWTRLRRDDRRRRRRIGNGSPHALARRGLGRIGGGHLRVAIAVGGEAQQSDRDDRGDNPTGIV